MNGSHSGNGTVKSEARKHSLALYRGSARRERNRDRRMARIVKGFRGSYKVVQTGPVLEIRRAER